MRIRSCLYAALAALLIFASWHLPGVEDSAAGSLPLIRVEIAGHTFTAETPIGIEARRKGLSGRAGLAPGRAMMFNHQPARRAVMHMRGMKFPLDFIWCLDGKVIGITANVPPAKKGDRSLIYSPGKVDRVIEINAGLSEKLGIKCGQKVVITHMP